jgi:hypothetical protein
MGHLKDFQSGTSNDPFTVGSSGSLTLSYGTANGVAYLNGSKVLTTGSALTFNGTDLGFGGNLNSSLTSEFYIQSPNGNNFIGINQTSSYVRVATAGQVVLNLSNTVATFNLGGSEKMSLTTTGLKTASTISVGNATPSTSGAGITFPATQSASTDANTLDDYEEGTFTPSFGSFDGTYSVRQAVYTKIGKVVTVQIHMSAATLGTSASNTISVSGFPFAALAGSTYGVSSSVHGTSWVTPRTSPNILMAGSSTAGTIYVNQFSGASGFNPLYSEMGTSGNLLFSMTYVSNN